MARITKRFVDSIEPDPDGKRKWEWDDDIKGFGLLVLPSGVKSYVYRYRNPSQLERRPTIGKHGKVTTDQARDIAKAWRQAVSEGRDPLGEKREQTLTPTVSGLLDMYLASDAFKEKAPSTQLIDRGRVDRHLRPLLGRSRITLLTKESIERARNAIRDGKTAGTFKTKARGGVARVRGGPITARECIGLLRAVFNWAIETKRAKLNPCEGVKLPAIGTRTAIVETAEDYARLFRTMTAMEEAHKIRSAAADAIRVLALTGARKSEIAKLTWANVDLKNGRIILPPSAHKTGRSTGKERVITLPTAAQEIIARQPGGDAKNFVFRPYRGTGPISLAKPWSQIRVAAAMPEKLGLHGLRHSVGSHLAMGGAQTAQIMEALGHRQLSTTSRYMHFAENARQALAERAAAPAVAGLTRSKGIPSTVTKLRGSDGDAA